MSPLLEYNGSTPPDVGGPEALEAAAAASSVRVAHVAHVEAIQRELMSATHFGVSGRDLYYTIYVRRKNYTFRQYSMTVLAKGTIFYSKSARPA